MIRNDKYPILEFDNNPIAKVNPQNYISNEDIPTHCVITFFPDSIKRKIDAGLLKQVSMLQSSVFPLPIYEIEHDGNKLCLVQGFLGAAGSAGFLEQLIAKGVNKFIVCGGAGVLQKDIQVGHLIIPYSAIRDEGVSYHYIEPSREIEIDSNVLKIIENELMDKSIPFIKAKTWTTDSFYRETSDKIAKRVSEGCVTVEMEAAALFAVAKFRKICLGQILYGGDDLSGVVWDKRSWMSRDNIHDNLLNLCLDICIKL